MTKAASPKLQPDEVDAKVEALVTQLIGRVADKWTMLVIEELAHGEELSFIELGRRVEGYQPENADADAASNGARWLGREDDPFGNPAKSRISADPPRVELGRGVLRRLGVGRRKSY